MGEKDSFLRRISKAAEALKGDRQAVNERGLMLIQSFSEDGLYHYLDCFGSLREIANLGMGGFDMLSNRQWNELARQLSEEQLAIMRLVEDHAHSQPLSYEQEQLLAELC